MSNRFPNGREKMDVIHARIIWKGGSTPMGRRYRANMRTPTLPLVMTTIFPIAPINMQHAMWMLRSLVREEW
jgi:hypothetical protein